MIPVLFAFLIIALPGCGGGGEKTPQVADPVKIAASSSSHSGALSAYVTSERISGILPGRATPIRAFANLWQSNLDGSGTQSNLLAMPLRNISGTSIDPDHDIAAVFDYRDTRIVFIRYSDATVVSTFSTQDIFTAPQMTFGGAKGVYTGGIILDAATLRLIAATSRGLLFIDYSNPAAPALTKQIPSIEIDAATGVEIMEHIALHPGLKTNLDTRRFIFTGGNYQGRTGDALVLVDADSGEIFRPDAETRMKIVTQQYIDSVALDTNYHVALLSDEGAGLTFLDLNQLQLDPQLHQFAFPAQAILRDANFINFTQVAIASETHRVFLAAGAPAQSYFVAELAPPSQGLGFAAKSSVFAMPTITYPGGRTGTWFGAADPHGAIATHIDGVSRAWWSNDKATVIAVFDLAALLDNASQNGYDPFGGLQPAARFSILP